MGRKKKQILLFLLVLVLFGVLVFALLQIWQTQQEYKSEEQAHQALLAYKPEGRPLPTSPSDPTSTSETAAPSSPSTDPAETGPAFVNETIRRLREDHPNALGWVSVPGTNIEYPFVQGPDNDYFLRRDVDGNYLYAGVPFLDYRCRADFSGVNSILYGHNLRNGTMFGALEEFKNQQFFDEHREIFVYLEDRTIRAEIIACLVIDPKEKDYVYAVQPEADHLTRLLADAKNAMELSPSPEQRFLTLSTCGYDYSGARIVLVGIITDY